MIGTLPKFVTHPDPYIYQGGNYVVLDFETTTINKGDARVGDNSIVLAVWELGPDHPRFRSDDTRDVARRNHYRCWGNEYELGELVEHCEQADFLIAHNAKFELAWLERCGLDTSKVIVWDTMIAEYVIGGNRWLLQQLSLENCAQRNFNEGKVNIISKMYKAGLCSTEIPASWLERYCVQDVRLTHRLFKTQLETCSTTDMLPIVYTRCLLTPVLADIEKNGMQLDPSEVQSLYEEKELEYATLQQRLDDFTGGININSPLQLREYLYETLKFAPVRKKVRGKWEEITTDSGLLPTSADIIAQLRATTKQQQAFLDLYIEYRGIHNELTKYLRKFQDCCKEDAGHLDADFNQTNTSTHRLSTTGTKYSCSFQNFPRDYKPLFTASEEGWVVGECDGAQLEFRVAAHLGRDEVALADIKEGRDVHAASSEIIGVSRQEAKAHTFKPLYGGVSGTEKEREYYAFFKDRYSGIANTQNAWIEEVLENKYLVTEWGMRYYWPHCKLERSGYITYTTSICNYPVQAFATAEIIPLALVCFWHRLKSSDLRMFIVNTVHDSIIAELPEEEKDAFHELAEQCLIKDVYPLLEALYGVKLTVPLGAGVMIGSHWGAKDETVYEAEESLYV